MAISFVAAGAVATGSNPTVALPAGYAQSDLLVIVATVANTVTTPAGWTLISSRASALYLFYKFADDLESNVTLTSAAAATKAVMVAYRGVSALDTISATNGATSTTIATGSLATTYANEFVVSVYGMALGVATWTAPASTTTRVDSAGTATLTGLLLVDELKATAGTASARVATSSVSKALYVGSFSIIPSDRYWVGGSQTWGSTAGTRWAFTSGGASGAPIPRATDAVFFDAASGAGVTTIGSGNTGARSINCTGYTGTLTGSININVYGSITLVAGMTYTYSGTISLLATGTLTTAGKTLGDIIIEGEGSTFSLGSALTSAGLITFQGGTFTTTASNYAVNATDFTIQASATKVVTLNASTVTLSGATGWNITGVTGTTINAGTSTINLTGSSSNFNGGGFTYNTVNISTPTFCSVTGTNVFSTLNISAPATTGISRVLFSANQTITTFVCAGASAVRRISLMSSTPTVTRTLTVGTYTTKTDVDFSRIVAAGASSPWSGTRLGNGGGNTSITFDAAKTVYWNLTGSQSWGSTGWAATSGGTPAVNNFPLSQDTAVFNNTGAATTVTISDAWQLGSVDMSARTSAMTLALSSSVMYIYGNLTIGTGVTLGGNSVDNQLVTMGVGAQTLTSAGKTFINMLFVYGSSLTLLDAFSSSSTSTNGAINLVRGTFDANGFNVTLSGGSFISTSNTDARTAAVGSGTWSIGGSGTAWNVSATNLTVTGSGTISFTSASAKTFAGGSETYTNITVNQGGAGALTISGVNTLGNISNTYSATGATTITFAGNQTVSNFTAAGEAGRLLTINSSVNGTARTLTKTTGTVNVDYVSIRDSTATGGAVWTAGVNSVNVSNNTGWIFTAAPPSTGNFLMFF